MALDPVLNFAKVDVDGGFAAAATAITLIAGEGAKLPQPSTDGAFNITWWDESVFSDPSDDPNVEIVRVTARATDVLTVTRAQEGTADTSKNTGGSTYKMVLSPTKKLPNDIQTQIQSGELVYAEDAGSNDTYVITLDPDPGVLTTGMVIAFKANTVNTGNATLNVNGLGAKNITKNVDQTLADGDIKADQRVVVIYNGVEFEMISQLGNPPSSGPQALTVMGISMIKLDPAAGTPYQAQTLDDETQLKVGMMTIPFDIVATTVAFQTGTVATGNDTVVTMYSEDGQTQIFSETITIASGDDNIIKTITLTGGPITIPAGNYYIACNQVGSGNASLLFHAIDSGTPDFYDGPSGQPVLNAEESISSGVPPATLTPGSLSVNTVGRTLAIRLDN